MSKEKVIHCPTEELWNKVIDRMYLDGNSWRGTESKEEGREYFEPNKDYCVRLNGSDMDCSPKTFYKTYILISAEEYLKEEFEVGDEVIVTGSLYNSELGIIVSMRQGEDSIEVRLDKLKETSTGLLQTRHYSHKDLKLIKKGKDMKPTEADIVVGSAWEGREEQWCTGKTCAVLGIDSNGDPELDISEEFYKDDFLACFKLKPNQKAVYTVELDITYNKPKKEKKMKRAEKVIKVGDIVFDRNCNNEGVVVGVFPESNQASYKDYNGGKVLTVSIDDLYLQFVAPPIVEVKPKKKKKAKKKVTK